MDDLARGLRIKERREELHYTQPAVVDRMNEIAPPELKAKGKDGRVITLRGYQVYEAGGGIVWDKAKVLAEVLGVDTHWLMTGEERPDTPDLLGVPERLDGVDTKFSERVDDVEAQLGTIELELQHFRAWSERAVQDLMNERAVALARANERLVSLEEKVDRLLHMVDEGLFTPRLEAGSRDAQIGLGGALAQAFQTNPEALQALQELLRPVQEPPRTARERKNRQAG